MRYDRELHEKGFPHQTIMCKKLVRTLKLIYPDADVIGEYPNDIADDEKQSYDQIINFNGNLTRIEWESSLYEDSWMHSEFPPHWKRGWSILGRKILLTDRIKWDIFIKFCNDHEKFWAIKKGDKDKNGKYWFEKYPNLVIDDLKFTKSKYDGLGGKPITYIDRNGMSRSVSYDNSFASINMKYTNELIDMGVFACSRYKGELRSGWSRVLNWIEEG